MQLLINQNLYTHSLIYHQGLPYNTYIRTNAQNVLLGSILRNEVNIDHT